MKKLYGIWFKGSLRGSWWQDADGSIFCSEYPQEMAAKKHNSFPEQDSDIREILLDGRPGDKPVEEDWRGHAICLPDPASFIAPMYAVWYLSREEWWADSSGVIMSSPHPGILAAQLIQQGANLDKYAVRRIGLDGHPMPETTVMP